MIPCGFHYLNTSLFPVLWLLCYDCVWVRCIPQIPSCEERRDCPGRTGSDCHQDLICCCCRCERPTVITPHSQYARPRVGLTIIPLLQTFSLRCCPPPRFLYHYFSCPHEQESYVVGFFSCIRGPNVPYFGCCFPYGMFYINNL